MFSARLKLSATFELHLYIVHFSVVTSLSSEIQIRFRARERDTNKLVQFLSAQLKPPKSPSESISRYATGYRK